MICKPFDHRTPLPQDFAGEMYVIAKSLKGKNRIHRGGVYYHVAAFREEVGFSPEKNWFLLQSKMNDTLFWVRQVDDPNVAITHISE